MSDQSDLPLFKMFQKAEPVAPASPLPVQAAGAAKETLAASAPPVVPEISTEPQILSIEELNVTIKKMLEGQLHLIWVRGEISNFKAHSSGHFYFSLKDAKSQISAVMFRGYNSRLRFKPADGVEVIVRGRISVYEPRGNYQILCESMEPVGAGALQKAFEVLKEKLKVEGLFEAARKKAIPTMPRHVAIVTSPTGAAIRDIINVLTRRVPWLPITIVPTVVQGEGSAEKICEAFLKAQRLPEVDVIILGRGGGSIEDLWAFNDERLARLIAAATIPIISAVGHEIDFTISDFVADLRAPTPSAAAELVAKSSQELTGRLRQLEKLLALNTEKHLKSLDQRLTILCKGLVDPQKKLQDLALRNDDLLTRLQMAQDRSLSDRRYKLKILQERLGTPMSVIQERLKGLEYHRQCLSKSLMHFLKLRRSNLGRLSSMLDTLSPLKVVERGYSVVRYEHQVVTKSTQVRVGDILNIKLAHGQLEARVENLLAEQASTTEGSNGL
jgi:exodeoxyribonuclease VII large subunit